MLDNTLSRRDWMMLFFRSSGALALAPCLDAGIDGAENWTPRFLSPQQNATLTALGERIIPGSSAAFCNRMIDLVMTVEDEKTGQALVEAIAAFGNFAALSAQEQEKALTASSSSTSARRPHFELLKEWLADTYWTSQQGLRDLGWNGQLAWVNMDACEHQ